MFILQILGSADFFRELPFFPRPVPLQPAPQQQLNKGNFNFNSTIRRDLFIFDSKICMRHNPGSPFLHGNGMNYSYNNYNFESLDTFTDWGKRRNPPLKENDPETAKLIEDLLKRIKDKKN